MKNIPLVHLEIGDRAAMVRARWVIFQTTPGIGVRNCASGPVMHTREVTAETVVLRANLLHPVWAGTGLLDNPNCPFGPIVLPRKGVVSE